MNKVYYSTLSRKYYLSFIFEICSIITIFLNQYISLIFLILSMLLFSGNFNTDIITTDKNNLYIISKQKNVIVNIISFVLLIVSFTLCINNLFKMGLVIFNLVFFGLNVANYITYKINQKIIMDNNKINEMFKRRSFNYFIYRVDKVIGVENNRFLVKLSDIFDERAIIETYYNLDKNIKEYKNVYNLFANKIEKS